MIPNGIPAVESAADRRARGRAALGAGPDEIAIALVARLFPQKRHESRSTRSPRYPSRCARARACT